jgi:hypothetical protein
MSVNFHARLDKTDPAVYRELHTAPDAIPAAGLVNWRAVRQAEHACCCLARPMVVAVMPPVPGRPHRTELLLCSHHYRSCRAALAVAGATVVDMTGVPLADTAWPEERDPVGTAPRTGP